MGEVGEKVREREREKGGDGQEVRAPGELRLAYRDEMTGVGPRRLGATEAEAGMPPLSAGATLPVGPVKADVQDPPPQPTRTVPAQSQPQAQPQQRLRPSPDTRPPPSHQPPHAPTGQPETQTTPQPRNLHRDRNPDSAVPAWLDRAIVGVAVGLAVMVCRKLVYL